jgi:hypothetical protein
MEGRAMFRFTIRELLILTVTAGLAVGWWIDHRRLSKERGVFEQLAFMTNRQHEADTGKTQTWEVLGKAWPKGRE